MPTKFAWLWDIYVFLLLIFAVQKVQLAAVPTSESFLFYYMLRHFDATYYLAYINHVIYIILNLVHCIPLFCFIHRIRLWGPEPWKILFILRCIFELTGNMYLVNMLVSYFHTDPYKLLLVLALIIIVQVPSYVVCYWYAFRRDKLIAN